MSNDVLLQKMVSTAYTNFNTFGLCLTFVVGTTIIVLSHTIEPQYTKFPSAATTIA